MNITDDDDMRRYFSLFSIICWRLLYVLDNNVSYDNIVDHYFGPRQGWRTLSFLCQQLERTAFCTEQRWSDGNDSLAATDVPHKGRRKSDVAEEIIDEDAGMYVDFEYYIQCHYETMPLSMPASTCGACPKPG